MQSALQWRGNLSISNGEFEVPTLEDFLLDGRYLWNEKQKLIDAIEDWLWAEQRSNKTCGNPKCLSTVCHMS